MAFLDEEEAPEVPEAPERPSRRADRPERQRVRQQFLLRRLIAVGVGLAFLILFIVGVKGCLDARKERGIRNYTSDVSTIMSESEQVGKDFFELLENPKDLTDLQYEAEIRSLRGQSEGLLSRAEKLDTPGEMEDAQQAVEFSLKLRRNALEETANNVKTALGNEDRQKALDSIADQMGALFASDSLWTAVAVPEITEVLDEQAVEGASADELPKGNFMPETNPEEWLDTIKIGEALGQVSGSETAAPGSHGLGLVQTMLGGTVLQPDVPNTISGSANEVEVQIQNQGETDETDVTVVVSVGGEEETGTIAKLAAGETGSAKVQLPPLEPGAELTIEVTVTPVPGEQIADDNTSSYPVTFQ